MQFSPGAWANDETVSYFLCKEESQGQHLIRQLRELSNGMIGGFQPSCVGSIPASPIRLIS